MRSASCNIDILKLKIEIGTEVQFCDAFTEVGQQKKSIGYVSPLKLAFCHNISKSFFSELTSFDKKESSQKHAPELNRATGICSDRKHL